MATKIYRVTRSTGSKLDEARLAAIGRALGVKPSAEPVERLRLGWAAYVDTIASKDDLKAAGLTVKEQSKAPATVKAPATGVEVLTPGWTALRAFVEKASKRSMRNPLSDLRGPALAEDVSSIEKTLERKLPDDYLAWLALHDGGEGDLGGGPFPWGVLSLARSAQAMLRQKDLAKMMKGYRVEDDDERVRPVFWDKGWFPFSDSGGGDYKCLDLAPTKAGVKGQVIDWPHDDNRRAVEAPCFSAWVERLVDALQSGEYVVDDGSVTHWRHAKNARAPKKKASRMK